MDRPNSFLTTPVAILLSAFVISIAILMHGGVIKVGGTVARAPQQAAQQPSAVTPPSQVAPPAPGAKVDVSVGHLPVKGKDSAKVTIVEFADFRCPFCEKFFTDTVSQITKDYIDSGKVKFAFRHYQFLGPASITAGNGAECANEQGKFWEYHDWLYKNQPSESDTSMYTTDKLTQAAQTLGMNADKFSSCLSSTKYAKNVSDDLAAGQKAGVNGTPATFINGQLISGAQPYANFKTLIDAELAK